MSGESKIEWCDRGWEVTAGCTKVSSGCANCYAEKLSDTRLRGVAQKRRDAGLGGTGNDLVLEVLNNKGRWNGIVRELPMNLGQPLRRKAPTVYFVNTRSDLFHEGVSFVYIDQVFAVMALCPQHRFLVLTKRPERMREYLTEKRWVDTSTHQSCSRGIDSTTEDLVRMRAAYDSDEECALDFDMAWPLPNVWLGTSVEDQATADARLPELLACPAAGRFVSAEPLLGTVDFDGKLKASTRMHLCMDVRGALRNKSFDGFTHPGGGEMSRAEAEDELWKIHAKGVRVIPVGKCDDFDDQTGCRGHRKPGLDWVIVGGESGAGARACELGWIQWIVNQCREAGVPVFVKQLGKHPVIDREPCGTRWRELGGMGTKGHHFDAWPADLRVREVPDGLRVGGEKTPSAPPEADHLPRKRGGGEKTALRGGAASTGTQSGRGPAAIGGA